MRISKNKTSSRKRAVIVLLLIVLIASLGYGAYAYTTNSWPFGKPTPVPSDTKDSEDDGESPDDIPDSETPNQSGVDDEDKTYVDTPVTNPPKVNDPYPIENQHYKITQQSSSSYHITLYPVINNPKYSNYNAQLKAYKNEALDYLKKRYGSIDNFTITWTPPDAEDT